MVEISLFRFDRKIDLESYYKPYIYEDFEFLTLRELLLDIKRNDPYFKFGKTEFVKINEKIVNLDENLDEIFKKTGNFIKISALCQTRSTKDLIINNDGFIKTYDKFSEILGQNDEKEFFLKLEPLFYSSKIREFKEDFLGNSAFVFANYLIEKFPHKKDEILNLIKNEIIYYIKPQFLLKDPFKTDEIVKNLAKMLNLNFSKKENSVSDEEIKNATKKVDFSKFNIAVYSDKNLQNLVKVVANLVNFELENENIGYDILKFDKKVALNLASEILFSAYDSGADFLLVNDKRAFYMFDALSKELQKVQNRSLNNFYILMADEFLSLLKGENIEFKNHKLEVRILWN